MYRRHIMANLEWFGYSLIAVMVIGLVAPIWGADPGRRLMMALAGILLGAVIVAAARAGAPRSAALVAVAGAWAVLTVSAWTSGGALSVSYVAYLIPILAAGVLLGRRAAAIVLAASLVSGFLMAMAEVQQWLPSDVVVSSPWTRWSSRSLVLGIALAIFYGADLAAERAFARAQRDLEDRKRAEAAAHESAERLRVAMQAARMAAWEWNLETGAIAWSDEAPTLIGWPADELPATMDEAVATLHPEDRESFLSALARFQEAAGAETIRLTNRVLTPDGTVRWFEELGQRLAASDDRPARTVGVLLDVSEKRRFEEMQAAIARGLSMQIGTDFFRSLAGHLAAALGVDIAFVGELVADGSRVRTLGVSENGLLAPDFEYSLRGAPCEAVVGGGVCMYPAGVQQRFPEDRMLAEKGIEGYGGQPLQDSSGRSMGLLTVLSRRPLQRVDELESILKIFAIRAATELERTRAMRAQAALEDQLRQVQKMETIGQLAGGVAHDFNNLLSPILGYADLLLDDLPPGDHRAASLRTIKDAAERAAALTRQLLTFSRRQVLDVRVFDLNEAVAGFEAILRRTIREDIDIRFRYHPAPAFIRGDVSQFEQILMNLVVNARDAMPAGGEIVIETGEAAPSGSREEAAAGQPGRLITLTVADSGSGMTPEVLQHVFEPFFTTKEKGRGTGLGLSTVYGIVSQHRGSITIDSQPGAGTRVAIQLPAADPATADTVGAQASAAAAPEPADETIVVVEDDETVRRLVCAVLRHRGYQVVDFPGPRECLDQGIEAASGAALLLTDIIMPGLNGRQLYERLKPHCPALRVLYMSGYAHSVTADRAVGDDGAIDLLPKPFTVDGLVQRVRQAIQRPELPHGAPRLLKG